MRHAPRVATTRDVTPADLVLAARRLQRRQSARRAGSSFCEWKGNASYLDVLGGDAVAERTAWTYLTPTPGFALIADHVALYAAAMDACFVDGERVRPQPGGFYGGWITDDVVGPFKGIPGSTGW